jgi:hypothetical protein
MYYLVVDGKRVIKAEKESTIIELMMSKNTWSFDWRIEKDEIRIN